MIRRRRVVGLVARAGAITAVAFAAGPLSVPVYADSQFVRADRVTFTYRDSNTNTDKEFPSVEAACTAYAQYMSPGSKFAGLDEYKKGDSSARCLWTTRDGEKDGQTGVYAKLYCPAHSNDRLSDSISRMQCECDSGYIVLSGRCAPETGDQRPTAKESEQYTAEALHSSGQKAQQSFKGGKLEKYGTRGTTRPDSFVEELSLSVEVKNYNLSKGTSNLVNTVANQAIKRQKELPPGSKQALVIDVRGQKVSDAALNKMFQDINTKSGNLFENRWWVLMD